MRKLFLLIIGIALTFNSNAQLNFRQGYVITIQGDTIHGWIKYNSDISLSKKCVFKEFPEGERTIYKPFDISSYRFLNDKYFISKTITRDNVEENFFLEYLFQGEINLYTLKDDAGVSYFFEKPNEQPIEVREEFVTKYVGNYKTKEPSKKYIGVLSSIFSDEPQIRRKVSDTNLNRKSLIGLSKEYHEITCTSEEDCIIYQKTLPKKNITVSALLGYGSYEFKSKPTLFKDVVEGGNVWYLNEFDINEGFLFGISSEISVPFSNDRLLIGYEAIVNKYHVTSYWERGRSTWFTRGKYILEATDLSHSFTVRYNLLRKNLKPSLYCGGFLSHHLQVKKDGLMEQNFLVEIYPEHSYFGLLLGFGISYEVFEQKDYSMKFLYRKGFDNFGYFETDQFVFSFSIPFFNFEI